MEKIKFEELLNQYLSKDEIEQANIKGDFTAKLIAARKKRNLTQKELAERAGLKQSAIARIENESALPRIETVYKILNAIGSEFIVDVEEFKHELEATAICTAESDLMKKMIEVSSKLDRVLYQVNALAKKVENFELEQQRITASTKKPTDKFHNWIAEEQVYPPMRLDKFSQFLDR